MTQLSNRSINEPSFIDKNKIYSK